MNRMTQEIGTILMAVVGLAIIAVLVSRNAQTSQVIGSAGSAFSNILRAATSPVGGGFGGIGTYSSF